jgi:DNA-nicking Smr family endonuclease
MSDRKRLADLTDDERRLFETEMQGVRPVSRGASRVTTQERPRPEATRTAVAETSPTLEVEISGEQICAFDPSLSPAFRRDLRQGGTPPEAVLDLHGLRAAEARRRVEAFVHEARSLGRRCVLLVTGRGLRSGTAGPVLRQEVVEILTHPPQSRAVLGLVSAPPSLGGPGALLVLLRKI